MATENHIVVVTALDQVAMQMFVRLLRLRHHVRGHADYYTIDFLTWSKNKSVAPVCKMLHAYDNVYLMLAHSDDSKTEFLRANLLRAKRCVLLSDKTAISQLDGEAINAPTNFHYLAMRSLLSEYGVDTTSGLLPIVELTVPRTMKILDTALKKRTIKSYYHRQQIDAFLRKAAAAKADTDEVPHPKRHHKGLGRPWTKKLVQQLLQQGADNIASLETSYKLRKHMHLRHSTIRQEQDASANRSTNFDATGTIALLPFLAAGYGFSDDIFDNMLCQSFFTPGLLKFIDGLLFAHCRHDRPRSSLAVDDSRCDDESDVEGNGEDRIITSSIVQVSVPAQFVSKTYGEMFTYLIDHEQAVAIGLYRGSGIPFSLPYVVTGPASDTVLARDDLVFALAQPAAHRRLDPSTPPPTLNHKLGMAKPTPSVASEPPPPPPTSLRQPTTTETAQPRSNAQHRSIHQLVFQSSNVSVRSSSEELLK